MPSRLRLRSLGVALTFAVLLASCSVASAATYTAVTSTGTIVPGVSDLGIHCDDCTAALNLPFNVSIYGTSYDAANVSSNGVLEFTSDNADNSTSDLPVGGFSNTIFAYWSDQDVQDGASGNGVFTNVTGTAPHRTFVVEWRSVYCCSPGPPVNDYEVLLHEDDPAVITMIYGDLLANGEVAGIQKDNSDVTQFAFVNGAAIAPGTRVDLYDDTVAPVTTDNVPGSATAVPFSVTLTASDAASGVATTYYTTDGSTPNGGSAVYDPANKPSLADGERITYFSVDNAGNAEAPLTSLAVQASSDTTAPVTTDDVPSGWQNAPVEVTLTGTDAGSGVSATYYTTDGSTPGTSSNVYDPAFKPQLFGGEQIRYFSIDNVGNTETVETSPVAQVETLAPVTTDDVDADWHNARVAVYLDAADDDSGVDATYYTTDGSVPTIQSAVFDWSDLPTLADGERIRYRSTDTAGNLEVVKASAPAHVDTIAPLTTDDVPATATVPYTVTLTAADAASGIAWTFYTTDGSEPGWASAAYDPAHKPILAPGQKIRYLSIDVARNVEAVRTSNAVAPAPSAPAPPAALIPPVTIAPSPLDSGDGRNLLRNAALSSTSGRVSFSQQLPAGTITDALVLSSPSGKAAGARRATASIALGKTTRKLLKAGTVRVTIRLGKVAMRALRRHPHTRLVLKALFVSAATGRHASANRVLSAKNRAALVKRRA